LEKQKKDSKKENGTAIESANGKELPIRKAVTNGDKTSEDGGSSK
jgi:hypothetical protein